MKYYLSTLAIIIISLFSFSGCSKEPQTITQETPASLYIKSSFEELPNWNNQNHKESLELFINSCKNSKTKSIYKDLCEKAATTNDAKLFFMQNFTPHKIINNKNKSDDGLLTGYYEPFLRASLEKKEPYIYPIYTTPKDLITVELDSIYSELKKYRLRGKLEGNKLKPYPTREQIDKNGVDADVICYTDSKINLFFLEVQGSGVAILDDNKSMYIGYDNQNGHKYNSIGKYLIDKGEIEKENISLQSIKEWLLKNPNRIDEVLNHNSSKIFFKQNQTPAKGAMGVVLTPWSSIAVDKEYIELGSMLYLSATDNNFNLTKIVTAQDTGGAIKGSVRADLFLGQGEEAQKIAGKLQANLKLWILLPNGQIK